MIPGLVIVWFYRVKPFSWDELFHAIDMLEVLS